MQQGYTRCAAAVSVAVKGSRKVTGREGEHRLCCVAHPPEHISDRLLRRSLRLYGCYRSNVVFVVCHATD